MCIDLIDRANIITCKTLKSQHTFQLGQFRCDIYKSSQPNTECAYYYAKERHTECAYYY